MRCTAWVPGAGAAADALARDGVRHRFYNLEAMKGPPAGRLAASARMWCGLASAGRAIAHVHNPIVYGLIRPALRTAGLKTVVHFHLEPSQEEIAWTLSRPPSHIITCARYLVGPIRAALDERNATLPVTAVPNAIDLDRFRPGDRDAARARLGLPTRRFVIITLANLAPHKGQMTGLLALRRLLLQQLDVEYWIVGEDRSPGAAYESHLRARAAELGLADRVRLLGFRRDVPDLLQAADAFVLASTLEGLPLSILEAQAAGIPVVASTIPGVTEVVDDGSTGFIVPADDAEGYAQRLRQLLCNQDLRARITETAADRVSQEHSWARFEQRVFDIYAGVAT
jgi:glycosyltransferase involved in cell wall biosynthesis